MRLCYLCVLLSFLSCTEELPCLSNTSCEDSQVCRNEKCVDAAPGFFSQEAAGIRGLVLTLDGRELANATRATLGEEDLSIVSSSERQLELLLPESAQSGELVVEAAATYRIALEVFDYECIQLPETPGTNAKPLSIDIDDGGVAWVNQEFHKALQRITPESEAFIVEGLTIPVPDEGPFATTIFGDRRTSTSTLGEDVEIDDQQNVWFTQGGGSLYRGDFENHSRIVRFVSSEQGERFDVFNVPDDHNEVIGLAIDGDDLWFAQGNFEEAALWRFRPNTFVPDDGSFDFSMSLNSQICEGEQRDGCFEKFLLPTANAHPAHLVVDDDGWVWVTEYFRTALTAFNPESGVFKRYPQAPSEEKSHELLGSGPWEIFIDDMGDVVFNSYFDNTITWFDRSRRDDDECLALDANQQNPCAKRIRVDDAIEEVQVHSVVEGENGRVWFTTAAGEDEEVATSIGYVTRDDEVVRFPTLSQVQGCGGGQNGIALDPRRERVWFTEFFNESVGLLTRR